MTWACWPCRHFLCQRCYDADRIRREVARRDVSRLPTFLRCANLSSFTLQVPHLGAADEDTGAFSVRVQLRVARLPVAGQLQSLLRFPLADPRRPHLTSVFLNSAGLVLGRPLAFEGEHESAAKVRAGVWAEVAVVCEPSRGVLSSFVNGVPCHVSSELDPADLRLQGKLVLLGGGKQAQTRGGDVRGVTLHSWALSAEQVQSEFLKTAHSHPCIGGRLVRLQALVRGRASRKRGAKEEAMAVDE